MKQRPPHSLPRLARLLAELEQSFEPQPSIGTTEYHIRRKLPRNRGNQWYKDTSHRHDGTYCGASLTDSDIGCRDKATDWTDHNTGRQYTYCRDCAKTRETERAS